MDFSAFEREIEKIVEGLRDEVRRIRPGGLSVEDVENVKVTLKKANDKGQKMVVKVGEMAQVVARGRTMVVLVGEKEHTKPLLTALSSSPLSINPLPPSPTTPFELHIPIPPTTTESRQTAIAQVSAKGKKALFALREARGAEKKRLNALKLGNKVGPDMLRRGETELERVNEKGVGEVKKVVEGGRRGLGDGGG
ncbi:MAG: hypothetical protein L6R41_004642 [Letrouitia leprolyta]|nr:MAG: hypothetical protein L6R41_004642 [Letrouitia leprolyta]